jgi:hypothetical protein
MAMIYIDDETFEMVKRLAAFGDRPQAAEVRIAIRDRAAAIFSSPNPVIRVEDVVRVGELPHPEDAEPVPMIEVSR